MSILTPEHKFIKFPTHFSKEPLCLIINILFSSSLREILLNNSNSKEDYTGKCAYVYLIDEVSLSLKYGVITLFFL